MGQKSDVGWSFFLTLSTPRSCSVPVEGRVSFLGQYSLVVRPGLGMWGQEAAALMPRHNAGGADSCGSREGLQGCLPSSETGLCPNSIPHLLPHKTVSRKYAFTDTLLRQSWKADTQIQRPLYPSNPRFQAAPTRATSLRTWHHVARKR